MIIPLYGLNQARFLWNNRAQNSDKSLKKQKTRLLRPPFGEHRNRALETFHLAIRFRPGTTHATWTLLMDRKLPHFSPAIWPQP